VEKGNFEHVATQLVEAQALQDGGSWVPFPMVSLEIFMDILPAALWPWARLNL